MGLLSPSGLMQDQPGSTRSPSLVMLRSWVGRVGILCSDEDWAMFEGRILVIMEFSNTVES